MSELSPDVDPDWEVDLTLKVSPAMIFDVIFTTADAVHTSDESCVDAELVVSDVVAVDEVDDNYCRLAEQRYTEDDEPDTTWHDWAVELRIQGTYIVGHWRAQVPGSPSDWEWCSRQAEKAFAVAAVLVGRKVREGIVVEEPMYSTRPPRTRH